VKLVYECTSLPGQCFICCSPNRDWFIDTLMSVDRDDPFLANGHLGAVYICCECVRQMATMGAWISPDEYQNMKETAHIQAGMISELTEKLMGMEQALDGLRQAGYTVTEGIGATRIGGFSPQIDEGPREKSPEERKSVATRERKTPEPIDDEGMDFLRSDGSESPESSEGITLEL